MNEVRTNKPSLFKVESKCIISTTDMSFDEEVFESALPVLVLFGAERCAQCKEMLPDVEEIVFSKNDALKACWVDIDKYKSLATRLRIRGIPNLLLFKDGAMESRLSGLQSDDNIIKWLDNNL